VGDPHDPHATLARLKRVGVIGLACLLALSGACGGGSSDEQPEPGGVGAGLQARTTLTGVTQPSATTRVTAAADPCATKPTSTSVVRDNRLKMVLSVSGVCFDSAADIGLSLVVTNTSSSVIHYDPNQLTVFAIRAPRGEQKRRWEDDDCATRTAEKKRALDLAPGASVTLATTYPAPANVADRDSCRRLETGDYEVQATLLVCDESYEDGYCDTAKDTQYQADPLTITLRG
jgi:hypothetical protein